MARIPKQSGTYDVRNYGAAGDGTTDDTAAIDRAITAMTDDGGGVLLFPFGKYKTSGGHTISVPCLVQGQGQGFFHDDGGTGYTYSGTASSLVRCTSATAYAFTFTTPHAEVADLSVQCTATTPTAGGAFQCAGDGGSGRLFSRYQFRNVTILDGYYGIEHAVGAASKFRNVLCVGQRKYCLLLRNDANSDAGDCSVNDCVFLEHSGHTTDAAIRYESGGGLKILNTKVVGPNITHGLWLHYDTGANSGQLLVSNCSIDSISGNGIRLETAGTGTFANAIIGNCYINPTGTTYEPIYLNNGGASGSLSSVSINHCHIVNRAATGKPAITVTGNGGVDVMIGIVEWGGVATALYAKGAGDSVFGGFYPDPNTGLLTLGNELVSAGTNAGLFFQSRDGGIGYVLYSASHADGVRLYDATSGTTLIHFPGTPPTVSGSRGGNAALASLITQLASIGLIVDGTT